MTLLIPLPTADGLPASTTPATGPGAGAGAGVSAVETPPYPVRQDVNKMFRARCWAELNQGRLRHPPLVLANIYAP